MSLRPRIYVVFILCLWLLTPVQGADAQQGILAPPDPAQADHTQESTPGQAHAGASTSASDEEGLIRLDVTVHDENGDPVSGLTPTDFTLLENNKPDKILSFRAFDAASQTTEPPVELILFLDTVSLSESQASVMRRETAKFLRQNGGHLSQPVSIFWLAASGLWIPPQAQPSFDGNGLAEALEYGSELQSIWSARNAQRAGTPDPSFLNFLPLRTFGWIASAERQTFGRKILVWIGPSSTMGTGAGQNLFDTIVWFSTLLREARISLYSLSVASSPRPRYQPSTRPPELPNQFSQAPEIYESRVQGVSDARYATLIDLDRRVLALQSGGRVMNPSIDLAQQINSCVADAAAWYVLRFDPQPPDHLDARPHDRPDEYHELKVVIGKAGLTASTNTGFYDQPYYEDRPPVASKGVSVDQLAQLLATAHGSSDAEMARQLSDMELTERLSRAKLATLEAGLRGNKARQALLALADASAFLDPPAAEIPAEAPPDAATQREIQAKTVAYLTKTIPKLPNLFATRSTIFYAETAAEYKKAGEPGIGYRPLHVNEVSKDRVLLRDGKAVAESEPTKRKKTAPSDNNLTTYGTFGPILSAVIIDVAAGNGLSWSHWEQSAVGPLAVFRFKVQPEKSHYTVKSCCLPDGDGTIPFQQFVGYHGEITIDPATGTIFRLALEADLKTAVPLARSDLMVEYGPVKIGSNTYFCPERSVSIMRGRTTRLMQLWDESFTTFGPFVTKLNDATFGEYHRFGAESRMLPGYTPAPD